MKWRKLNDLIGSSNGDKFAKAVQGLLFGDLINKANIELAKITNRYSLIQEGETLSFKVTDAYQNGEVRSLNNLSGGESFIVSLALALGLSDFSNRKTSADLLFLDEGFGTLDNDVMETALNALATVKNRKKLIGIISHVDLLKDKTPARINVEPQGGGRSVLSGIGVRKLND
jgi:exonuclease SbcC